MARPPSGKGPPKAATGDDDKRIWNRVTSTVTPPVRRKAARWEQQKLWDQEAAARAAQPPMQQY